jgi:hypothetical protein
MSQVNVNPGDSRGSGGPGAVAAVAIVVLVLLAIFAAYYLFVGDDGEADIDVNVDGSPTSHVLYRAAA